MNIIKLLASLSFIISLLVFSSCRNTEPEPFATVQALPVDDTLSANIVSLEDQTEWFSPLRILNVNDEYLIISEYNDNDFLHVFKLPDLAFLYTWGKQGKGPDEFSRTPVYFNTSKDVLIPYEGISRRLRFYEPGDSTLVKSQSALQLSYENQMDPLNRIRRINDSLYFADYGSSTEDTDHEHIALRPGEREPLFTFGEYPDTELEGYDRYGTYIKDNTAKPDGSKFAAFYTHHNMFKIYDSEGQLLRVIQVDDPIFSDETENIDDRFLFRITASASDKYIYLLGINGGNESIWETPDPSVQTSLEIWDWEGQPVYRAMFDRLVQNITVSEKHGKIYGFSSLAANAIYEYDLTEILD